MNQRKRSRINGVVLRHWASVFFVNSLVLLFCILLMEFLLRLSGHSVPENQSLFAPSAIPGLIYENRPGFSGKYADQTVHINSLGLRGSESTEAKPPGTYRILVLGDSFAFGHGVTDADSFPAQTENLLNSHALNTPDGRFEVLNAGVNGYNTLQESIWLQEKGFSLTPDLVILAFFHNDLGNPFEFTQKNGKLVSRYHAGAVPIPAPIKTFLRQNSVLYWFIRRHLIHLPAQFGDEQEPVKAVNLPYSSIDAEGWESNKKILREIKAACDQRQTDLLLLHIPDLSRDGKYTWTAAREEFIGFCGKEKIPCLDIRLGPDGSDLSRFQVSRIDHHFNQEGNQLVAEAVVQHILASATD